ncbi:Hsp70 family protein [Flaviflagellibacter deserti]|uniref:Hsp70 family protein n=1 Tax=Flaviflagellibacter deserti TaxID=2267266 RepID=A0ABV9Z963_9HYPH
MAACGLDFGTSNTTLGTIAKGRTALLALEGSEVTIPSAIFYEPRGGSRIGRAAIGAYVEGLDGRLMRSLKSVLGSSLLNEITQVGRERLSFRQVIAGYIGAVKKRAEAACGHELTQVVHGRPVHFVDGNEAGDRKAEEALREIAHEIGFKDVIFQYEPIAAALDYEQQIDHEEIALIADIGGGTSDFSIIRLGPGHARRADRAQDILANDGVRIGGTDFDRQISLRRIMPQLGMGSPMKRKDLDVPSSFFHDLASWHSINRLYDPAVLRSINEVRRDAAKPELIDRLVKTVEERRGHALAGAVEAAKIGLSDVPETTIPLDWLERDLEVSFGRHDLAGDTADLADRIAARIGKCLAQAGINAKAVDAVFLTGGSTKLTHVREAIAASLPDARAVTGDSFGSVGLGLTIDAKRRFGH